MEKNEKNEELQNRREFFKKAAKSALPILGAIVLAGAPQILKATEKSPMGCNYGCAGACYTQCYGCLHSCNTVCVLTVVILTVKVVVKVVVWGHAAEVALV